MDEYATIADLYDHVTLYRERADVAFFVEAAWQAGGPVLELGCGTGRVLVPTARAGVSITGLDSSPRMLALCQARLEAEPESVQTNARLVAGDMRDFSLPNQFQLITIPFRPFQHLTTVEDQRACLQSIRRHLAPGGKLILDLFNPALERLGVNIGVEQTEEPEFTAPGGRHVRRSFRIVEHDRVNQINHVELIYNVSHADGRTERLVHAFPMRYLFRFEAEYLLEVNGFRVDELYADYDKAPYGSKYPGELIFVATRI